LLGSRLYKLGVKVFEMKRDRVAIEDLAHIMPSSEMACSISTVCMVVIIELPRGDAWQFN
jgi:hypothetical protein